METLRTDCLALLRSCLVAAPSRTLLETLAARADDPDLRVAHPGFAAGWGRIAGFLASRPLSAAVDDAAAAHRVLLGDPLAPRLDPYGSRYRDGSRVGPSLVAVRGFLDRWGLAADRDRFRDLEDHGAFLLDCLVELRRLERAEPGAWGEAYAECLAEHVLPWMPRFLEDLAREDEALERGGFYAGLARVGRAVLEWEAREALTGNASVRCRTCAPCSPRSAGSS